MRTCVVLFLPVALIVGLLQLEFGCQQSVGQVASLSGIRIADEASALRNTPEVDAGKPRVKLAVLVVFDQMRGDYLEKWKPLLAKGGFARLQTEGATFTKCNYPYGTTTTGPGHASMLSGTCGDRHGIVNNGWYEKGASVYCAGSKRYEFVPPPATKPTTAHDAGNPDQMLAETVADVLKATHPQAKIFGLSLKDRSAVLPTGKRPDGAYWFNGQFVTSTYYADRVHPWVEEFNNSKIADRWFGKQWTRLRTDIDYEKWSGPDNVIGEGKGVHVSAANDPARGWAQGVVFPHLNTGGRDKPGKEYYESLANSPFGNELMLEFAKTCITAEKLGADDVPDLLVVSFSSNDLIGHTWGPDSQEVLDITLRSDAIIAELLAFLDQKVGKGQYLVGVTADHGICPLVELSCSKGLTAKRVDPKLIQAALQNYLTEKFAKPVNPAVAAVAGAIAMEGVRRPAWVQAAALPWLYFSPKQAALAGTTREALAKAAVEFLGQHPDIARAFTRADLEGEIPESDALGRRVKRSYHPERCGDVYLVLKQWYLPSSALSTGTTHGTPYFYDTHVPLLVYGPGIPGGTRDEATTPQAMAAIFARWLGVPNPNKAEFPVPATLEKK